MRLLVIILAVFMTVAVFAQDDMSGQGGGGMDQMSETSGDTSSSKSAKKEEWKDVDLGPQAGVWNEIRDIFRPSSEKEKILSPQPKKTGEKSQTKTQAKTQTKSATVRPPILSGVMVGSDKDCVAILGNNMVREGDQVEGFRVRSIKNNSITLVREGEEYVLFVKE